jgi:hypothetical protein
LRGRRHERTVSGVEERTVEGDGADIFVRTGGAGNPLLLIHGFPQTGAMWHKMAQQLAEHFFVVIPDPARLWPLVKTGQHRRQPALFQAAPWPTT